MSDQFNITEGDRRTSNILRFGKIEEVDYDKALLKVRIGDLLSAWLPWVVHRANNNVTWHALEKDEQVIVLCPSGEVNQGVVLGSLYQDSFPNPTEDNTEDHHRMTYKDGCVVEYDRKKHHLKAILPKDGTVEIVADGGISIAGDVTVTGKITATDNIKSEGHVSDKKRSMQADREIYNGHVHGGTPKPTPQK
ncbi:MAG: phage baseplate assembly protein V [Methylococcales bacterium]|nr:phage baseplate assembly protein V [Methylococcales bacterium]